MSTQSEFVRHYFIVNEIKQNSVAEKLHISPTTLSNMLTGARAFSKNVAKALSKEYGFSIAYLLMGITPEFASQQELRSINAPVSGIVTQGDNSPVNTDAVNASLRAENERLRNEVEWLRGQLAKKQ